jgi:hypothetical protein
MTNTQKVRTMKTITYILLDLLSSYTALMRETEDCTTEEYQKKLEVLVDNYTKRILNKIQKGEIV